MSARDADTREPSSAADGPVVRRDPRATSGRGETCLVGEPMNQERSPGDQRGELVDLD